MSGSHHETSVSAVRRWLPPPLRALINRAVGASITYRGPYSSWEQARAATRGYDEEVILQRVTHAISAVLRGEARYEQDGVAFRVEPPPSHALSGLLITAARNHGRLTVLDFGGGLASHYLRWRPYLAHLPHLRWAIVEQPAFVDEGRALFAGNPAVSFHRTIADVPFRPNAVLASSVLQYLPDPMFQLQALADAGADIVVIDRTPLAAHDAILTQHVPARLGKASYPLRVLAQDAIHDMLDRDYLLLGEFPAPDASIHARRVHAASRGAIWCRRA